MFLKQFNNIVKETYNIVNRNNLGQEVGNFERRFDNTMWDSSDEEEIENIHCDQPRRRPRTFRTRINYIFQSDFEVNERFRLSGVKLEELLNLIGRRLQRPTSRNQCQC